MENLKINHRIVEFIAHTKLSDTEFALKLGYKSVSEISRIRNDNDVPDIFIRRMKLAYPGLNIDWIYHGHLPMMMNEMHEPPLTYRSIKNINEDHHGKEIPCDQYRGIRLHRFRPVSIHHHSTRHLYTHTHILRGRGRCHGPWSQHERIYQSGRLGSHQATHGSPLDHVRRGPPHSD